MEWSGVEWSGVDFHSTPLHSTPFHSTPLHSTNSPPLKHHSCLHIPGSLGCGTYSPLDPPSSCFEPEHITNAQLAQTRPPFCVKLCYVVLNHGVFEDLIYIYIYIYIHTYVHIYIYVRIYIYICIHMCMCVCIYIYMYI